jgi:hypothetical protein
MLRLDKYILTLWKIIDIPTSLIWIIFFWRNGLYRDIKKFWGYVGTNAKQLCVELNNFVQRRTFVSCLNWYHYI